MSDEDIHNHVKTEIAKAIEQIRKKDPELAKHLEDNIVIDEAKKTVSYIGEIDWKT